MTDSAPESLPSQHSGEENEANLLELAIVFAKHKKLLLGLPLAAAILASGLSLLLPNIYTASTKILPPQQSQSTAAALLGQLGSVAGLFGAAGGGNVFRNPNDLYVAMLKSRTVADNLIQRFGLMEVYDEKYPSKARKRLEEDSSILSSKDGIITIEFDDKDPKRAAQIANAYVEELFKLTKVLAVTEASQRRLFFEQQFAQAKDNLAKAEIEARQALDKGGLVKVDDQGRSMVETTARLRAQITVKEVQIGAMRTFAAERNPDLRLAQQEVESLRSELAKIEGAGGGTVHGAASDRKGLDNLRLLRDLKYYEIIYELLAKQFEVAKIDEAKDSTVVQVMDSAIEPDRKSRPKRLLLALLTALVAGFLAICWVLIQELAERARLRPRHAERLNLFRSYFRRR